MNRPSRLDAIILALDMIRRCNYARCRNPAHLWLFHVMEATGLDNCSETVATRQNIMCLSHQDVLLASAHFYPGVGSSCQQPFGPSGGKLALGPHV